jgi:hypothetical protein
VERTVTSGFIEPDQTRPDLGKRVSTISALWSSAKSNFTGRFDREKIVLVKRGFAEITVPGWRWEVRDASFAQVRDALIGPAWNPVFTAFAMICVLDRTMSSCAAGSGALSDLTIQQSAANKSKQRSRVR